MKLYTRVKEVSKKRKKYCEESLERGIKINVQELAEAAIKRK